MNRTLGFPRLAVRANQARASSGQFYGSNNVEGFRQSLNTQLRSADTTQATWKKVGASTII